MPDRPSRALSRLTTRLPSPALLVAVLALLVALGGTTYAVTALPKHSVGPAQLKKGAVSSKAVKDHSLRVKDFTADELPPNEVLVKNAAVDSVAVSAVVGAPADTVIASMALPAGTYYVQASAFGENQSAVLKADLRCFLRSTGTLLASGTIGLRVPIEPDGLLNADRAFFTLDAAYRLTAPGTVSVGCNKGAPTQSMEAMASLSAIRTAKVTAVP